ncbi:hypothetical protein N7449_001985 [Penicillium cf. viridicatum]|uniref:Uncharacterized protein n=1 Tax=Penicillium cf. viridicatum TaxID=2972119 RepID=A0A9W9T354_9EURO|nr:hypothetical protein N7449_001985 [Penicillium cf. viridicatum]
MAAPGNTYFIQERLTKVEPHHESFLKLWETKWQPLAERALYPFSFGVARDFEPIVREMEALAMKEPYEWEIFAAVFRPHAENLSDMANAAEEAGQLEKASEYYLRSCAIWSLSRYPLPRCDGQRHAWEKSKEACLKGLQLRGDLVCEQSIPHKYYVKGECQQIPTWISLPDGASKDYPVPAVLAICGLDAWRTEMVAFADMCRRQGIAMVIVEIPGTGDSPALEHDPLSPDRQWSSVLDWIDSCEAIDSKRLIGLGVSTGGYYAIRVAHTHPTRFLGVVAQGGACHHMFDYEWLSSIDTREYAHSASEAFSWKWGFRGDVETFRREASDKFSLLKDGTLDKPDCARLLLVNGADDGVFPIDDYYLCLQHGSPKETRIIPNKPHMGDEEAFLVVWTWIFKLLGITTDVKHELSLTRFTPRY